jgi:lysophospholipase L1-like esterase
LFARPLLKDGPAHAEICNIVSLGDPPWLKRALKRGLFGLYVLVLLEVFGQLTMRITSGGWPIQDRGGLTKDVFQPHPYLIGVPRPRALARQGDVTVSINQLGYRGRDIRAEAPPDVLRVLALGGSTTFGVGLVDGETWPVALENQLNAALAAAPGKYRRAEVINGGVPGYTSAESLIQLALRGVYLRPDVVILFQSLNDLRNAHSPALQTDYANFHAVTQRGNLAVDRLRWGNGSGAIRVARALIEHAFLRGEPDLVVIAPRRAGVDPAAEEIYRSNLTTFGGICRAHRLACLYVPQVITDAYPVNQYWLAYLTPGSVPAALLDYDEVMKAVASSARIAYVGSVLEAPWSGEDFRDYCHFNAAGNRKFAELLIPAVLASVQEPPS